MGILAHLYWKLIRRGSQSFAWVICGSHTCLKRSSPKGLLALPRCKNLTTFDVTTEVHRKKFIKEANVMVL